MSPNRSAEPRWPSAPQRATWREWSGFALLLLPVLVLATDLTVLFLAMPSIAADLQPGTSQMLWILHVYGFVIAGMLITMGRLGDRIGRRRLLLIGASAFAVLSVVAANSTSPEMLIVVRALLGVAGATLMPSAFALLRNMFHDDGQRRFAIAVMFSGFSAGGAIGPLLGGVLLEFFWWGSAFLVNVPPLVVLVAAAPLLLPEYREAGAHRLDLASVGLSLGAMLTIVYGLQELAAIAEGTVQASVWPYLGVIVLGLALAVIFIRRQLRLGDPLLELTLFRNRAFSTSLGALVLTGIGVVGVFYLFTQYLQWVMGMIPLQAGLWTVPYIVVNIAGALLAPALVRRLRQVTVIVAGLGVAVAGLVLVAVLGGDANLLFVVAAIALAGLGHGASMALASDLIISTAPVHRAGSAAAMQETTGELGMALGLAVGGTIGMVVYRATLSGTLPEGVPQQAADAARESVPGALGAAERLPEMGGELLTAAREAFAAGLATTSGISAAVVAAAALLVVAFLRRAATNSPEQSPAAGGLEEASIVDHGDENAEPTAAD